AALGGERVGEGGAEEEAPHGSAEVPEARSRILEGDRVRLGGGHRREDGAGAFGRTLPRGEPERACRGGYLHHLLPAVRARRAVLQQERPRYEPPRRAVGAEPVAVARREPDVLEREREHLGGGVGRVRGEGAADAGVEELERGE